MIFAMPGIPSYAEGFARCRGDSPHPELWDGLVGLWAPYLGATGEVLLNWSPFGQALSGTLTNMDPATDWVGSQRGSTLSFNGNDNYVEMPNLGSVLDGCGFTVAALINPLAAGTGYPRVVDRVYDGQFACYYRESSLQFGIAIKGTGGTYDNGNVGDAALTLGTWQWVAWTYDGVDAHVYRNGEAIGSVSPNVGLLAPSTAVVRIGQRADSGESRAYEGQMALVYLFARPLASSQLQILYRDPFAPLRPRPTFAGRAPTPRPYRVRAAEVFQTGVARGELFSTGTVIGVCDGHSN